MLFFWDRSGKCSAFSAFCFSCVNHPLNGATRWRVTWWFTATRRTTCVISADTPPRTRVSFEHIASFTRERPSNVKCKAARFRCVWVSFYICVWTGHCKDKSNAFRWITRLVRISQCNVLMTCPPTTTSCNYLWVRGVPLSTLQLTEECTSNVVRVDNKELGLVKWILQCFGCAQQALRKWVNFVLSLLAGNQTTKLEVSHAVPHKRKASRVRGLRAGVLFCEKHEAPHEVAQPWETAHL